MTEKTKKPRIPRLERHKGARRSGPRKPVLQRNSRNVSAAHVCVINCLSGFVALKNLRLSSINPRFSILACKLFNQRSLLFPTRFKSELELLRNLFLPNCLRENAGSRPNDNFIASSFRIFLQLFRFRASISRKCRGKTSSRVEMWINRKSAIFEEERKLGNDVNERAMLRSPADARLSALNECERKSQNQSLNSRKNSENERKFVSVTSKSWGI